MTLWYRAPEVILDNLEYTAAIDLWSAGVIIFEMLTGQYMFQGNSEIDMLFKIFYLKGTPQQGQIKDYASYPHLMNYGLKFPKFKKRNLSDEYASLNTLGSTQKYWLQVIEGLTQIDPDLRMSPTKAIDII